MISRLRSAGLALVCVLGVLGCGQETTARDTLGAFVDQGAGRAPIRYFDSDLVSLNEVCPLTRGRLSPVIEPVYVNGRPIGFC